MLPPKQDNRLDTSLYRYRHRDNARSVYRRHVGGFEMPDSEPTLDDIQRAAERIRKYIRPTPLIHSDHLSVRFGTNVYLKVESLQYTGSYKTRGAANKIECLR